MKRVLRLLFCILAVTTFFQLFGIEQAFCEDSILEMDCQDCATCVMSPFSVSLDSLPAQEMYFIAFPLLKEPAFKIEEPLFPFFRPPITL